MRSYVFATIVLAATPVAAQPVIASPPCSIDLVRAPDDARKIVEAWIASTRRCSVALEVRIVETRGGLYVLARDDRGTVRDRVVPDAQTAGALIASWADDGQPGPVASVDIHAEVHLAPAPVATVEPPSLDPIVDPTGGPGAAAFAPSSELRDDSGSPHRPVGRPHHWVGEFLTFGSGEATFRGLRGEVDLLRGATWTAGLTFTIAIDRMSAANDTMRESSQLSDLGGTAYIAHAMRAGGWELRPAVGVGVVYTRVFDSVEPSQSLGDFRDYVRVSPIAEASLLASHDLVGNLAMSIGALVTAYGQQLDATLPELQHRDFDAMLVAGLRFGFL